MAVRSPSRTPSFPQWMTASPSKADIASKGISDPKETCVAELTLAGTVQGKWDADDRLNARFVISEPRAIRSTEEADYPCAAVWLTRIAGHHIG